MINLNNNEVVLFFGDSITDGARGRSMDGNHIMGHGYQYIISSRLAIDNIEKKPKFINKGVSGDNIIQMYSRLNDDVIKNAPTMISILSGINDVCRGLGLPLGLTTKRYIDVYKMMLDDIRVLLPKTKIIICEPFYLEIDNYEQPYKNTPYAMCEPFYKPANIPKDEKKIRQIKEEIMLLQQELKSFTKREELLYVPLQKEFDKYSKIVPAEYLVWDTFHPTIAGHEIIARKWIETVENSAI